MAQMLAGKGADVRMRYAARRADELVLADVLEQTLGERLQTFCSDAGQRIDLAAEIAALAPRAQMLVLRPDRAARRGTRRLGTRRATQRRPALRDLRQQRPHAAQPFWVELPRHHLRIEVPADRSLLDVLNDAGVETLFDCCRGECGLCAMDVLSVEGDIDHRDVFSQPPRNSRATSACAPASRASTAAAWCSTQRIAPIEIDLSAMSPRHS
jgi:vanillate O-demethylase ferredoxin subunit